MSNFKLAFIRSVLIATCLFIPMNNALPLMVQASSFSVSSKSGMAPLEADYTLLHSPLGTTSITNTVYLPLAMANYVQPVIPETTNILTSTTTAYLASVSDDGAVFTFTQSTPSLTALVPGEVMVGDVSSSAPNGFLRKVKTISSMGNQVIIETEPATLEDAIWQGAAYLSRPLAPSDAKKVALAQGVSFSRSAPVAQAATFYLKLEDVVVYDDDGDLNTKSDQVVANGSVEIEPVLNFSLRVQNGRLENLYFATSASEKVELNLETKLEKSLIKKEKELARYTLSPITVMIGPMPVVLVPILTINIGVDGSVHIGVKTGVTQNTTLTAGAQYANGTWSPVSQFTHQFTFIPPTLSAGLDFKGYAGPRLSLLLYGVTGPYMDILAYLKLEADVSKTPWWELYGGLEVPVGVRVEVLGQTLADANLLAIGAKVKLAQAIALKNGNFEAPPPWPTQDGHVEVQVAPDWRAWYLDQPPSYVVPPSNCSGGNPACYWMRPEFIYISAATVPQKVHGGSYAQRYFSYGRMHEAGLYQQVADVTLGSTLSFSVYMRAWMCWNFSQCNGGLRSDAPSDMHLRVGIDPTGGTDPFSPNVIWSAEVPAWDTWGRFQVQAVAQSSTVTVFTHSRAEWDWARFYNEVCIDDAKIE